MDEDFKKVKKCQQQRVESDHHLDDVDDNEPTSDAVDHLRRIEGYPPNKPAKMQSLPLPIRIIGYTLIGFAGLGFLIAIVLNWMQ